MQHAYDGFILDREVSERSPRTIQFYEEKLKRFRAFLADACISEIGALTTDHVRAFMSQRQQAGATPAGLHCEARSIRAFLNFCVDEDYLDPRIPARLKMPRVPKKVIQPFSMEQIQLLIRAAKRSSSPERDVAILLVLLDTGIRAGELCSITLDDVVKDRLLINGKGSKQRWVPISTKTQRAIWQWTGRRRIDTGEPWLFLGRSGRQMNVNTVNQLFDRLAEQTGIQGVRVSPHTCRHTTALEWVRDGAGQFELQKLLGHTTLAMTAKYVLMADQDVVKAHKAHSLVDRISRKR